MANKKNPPMSGFPDPAFTWKHTQSSDLQLSGQRVAVVGGTDGLGRAIARVSSQIVRADESSVRSCSAARRGLWVLRACQSRSPMARHRCSSCAASSPPSGQACLCGALPLLIGAGELTTGRGRRCPPILAPADPL